MYPILAAFALVGGTVFAFRRLFKRKTQTRPVVVAFDDKIAVCTTSQVDLYIVTTEKNLELTHIAELPIPSGFEFEVVNDSVHIKSTKEIRVYNQTGDLIEIKYL